MRALLLLWGIVKFSRRLVRPHTVPNNEVLDLLSRVPDDDELVRDFIYNHFVKLYCFFLDNVQRTSTTSITGNGKT